MSRGVRDTCHAEWSRANRVQRTFTEFGFSKGKLPVDLWASISSYYYNNRDHKVLEEWDTRGLYVNWWETDVFFIPMPWELKVRFHFFLYEYFFYRTFYLYIAWFIISDVSHTL